MCNAWNHPQECRCGWGGDGHTGKRLDGTHYTQWVPPLDFSFESYTRPNASCPACGQPVFFYSSPDGGRVFFDELGPPCPLAKTPLYRQHERASQVSGQKQQ